MEQIKNATPDQLPELTRDIQRITEATRAGVSTKLSVTRPRHHCSPADPWQIFVKLVGSATSLQLTQGSELSFFPA